MKYTEEHEWLRAEGDVVVVGITEHAATQLGDIVFVELPEVGTTVSKDDDIVVIESVKAASDILAPIDGEVVEVNEALTDAPGTVNEDPIGGYDPNRNWGSDWQPNYIQGGSMNYPFELPESRAINDFMMTRPNIAGFQSFHNSGGMILRPPGAAWYGQNPADDIRVYDEIGETGERMLPYYNYYVIWRGLYSVHCGSVDWTNDGLGTKWEPFPFGRMNA